MTRVEAVRSGVRWLGVITTIAALVASPAAAQIAPASSVNLSAREIDVMRDVMADQLPYYKDPDGRLCLDPTVAAYPAPSSTSRERWSPDALRQIAADRPVSLDTATTELPRGMRGCRRSKTTWRMAFGRPRVFSDSGAIAFIGTRLDARDHVDSAKFDYRLRAYSGKWSVDGWLAISATVHRYVNGNGCYRLWYAPLEPPAGSPPRIDTTEVRADSAFVGQDYLSSRMYRLSAGPRLLGVAAEPWTHHFWYVTHDSLHFGWSRGNLTLFADVLVAGDTLRGTMHSETDAVVPNPPTTPVSGRRIPCR